MTNSFNRTRMRPGMALCWMIMITLLISAESFTHLSHGPAARRGFHQNSKSPFGKQSELQEALNHFHHPESKATRYNETIIHNKQRRSEFALDEKGSLSSSSSQLLSRRSSLQGIIIAAATATAVASQPLVAMAGKPELDNYGNLYSPKGEMLSGGSDSARGIATRQRGKRLKPGQAVQSLYSARFITYLSRFLLNFDPAANAWWLQNGGIRDSWESAIVDDLSSSSSTSSSTGDNAVDPNLAKFKFAEFAESVEVGLADYFVGPYGSYSSVQAAKAGILASAPALSTQPPSDEGFLPSIFSKGPSKILKGKTKTASTDITLLEKQGILNLYSLLKARYTSIVAKRQLAILFSFISSPSLQPTPEIKGLLGEADNATISEINVIRQTVKNEEKSRTSSRRGGGYSINSPPEIMIETPPALGDDYRPAELRPIMKPTSRVLRIQVLDPGEGYTAPPQVFVQQNGYKRPCQACAIIDRRGHVLEVLVLDPGFGYGVNKETPPKVRIAPPNEKRGKGKTVRQAQAVADLEYEVVDIEVIRGGNGYVKTEPPNVFIAPPPVDPDWFLATQEQPEMRMIPVKDIEPIRAEVSEMRNSDGNVVFTTIGKRQGPVINRALVERLRRDPLELLPSSVNLEIEDPEQPVYHVASLPPIPPNTKIPSPRYRAYDPIFGGVGSVPVTKGAVALRASEYARLALSGAVCTVLVRTALNPLELIKTKQQLKNDEELFEYARNRIARKVNNNGLVLPNGEEGRGGEPHLLSSEQVNWKGPATSVAVEQEVIATPIQANETLLIKQTDQPTLGTADLIFSLAELRGPFALFQSADITFLASLVFGSFGFGATELFRRSFTEIFFSDGNGGSGGSEIVLLFAAALATVVTSAAATPFEVLRVKSMILLEAASWTEVLQNFISENGGPTKETKPTDGSSDELILSELNPRDLLPLWSGFAPTLSRELPFAIAKFLAFDVLARALIDLINSFTQEGALPVQVGVGPAGLAVSAIAGAVAGVAGAIVSHPADLILTYTSAAKSKPKGQDMANSGPAQEPPGWVAVVRDLLSREGGFKNLFLGLPTRATFFFLVIGLQFFLYDYVKNLFQVGTDDLSLVLDVFYAVRAGLVDMDM